MIPSSIATGASHNCLPDPLHKEYLGFATAFQPAQADILAKGYLPESMEDKWFIYYERGWLKFHRSWTGFCIYGLHFQESPRGLQPLDSWVNRDPHQYKETDTAYDRELAGFLIDRFLLNKANAVFPRRRRD